MNRSNYKPMVCPVCSEFYFSALTDEDYSKEQNQCTQCGWIYSLQQVNNPDWVDPKVNYSLNEYRKEYSKKKLSAPAYNYLDEVYEPAPHICPVCGKTSFSDQASFEICPACGWEDDPVMETEPDSWAGSANDLCLNDFRKRYNAAIEINPDYRFDLHGLPE